LDSFSADGDAMFGKQIFDIAVTEIEAIVKPDKLRNDIRRETVALVGIHPPIISILVSLLVSTLKIDGQLSSI
jgi:hypothetical protein